MMYSKRFVAALLATTAAAQSKPSLILPNGPPNFVRPYVVPHNHGPTLQLGADAYRFPITAPSSNGTITLLTTNGNASPDLNVFAHRHIKRFENFFCSRGGVQLWMQQGDDATKQQVRRLGPGDFGASPPNATHTFQIVEPNTEMYGVVFDGGLEDMFFAIGGQNLTWPTYSPYDPNAAIGPMETSAGLKARQALNPAWDIIPNPTFVARRDIVNGSAPSTSGWHTKADALPTDRTQPYYIARDLGPKYLASAAGLHQVVQPLHTPLAANATAAQPSFSLAWLSISQLPANSSSSSIPWTELATHSGFRLDEGAMMLEVEGYEPAMVMHGDVAFVPANTNHRYWGLVSWTKVLSFAAGGGGIADGLVAKGKAWNSPVFPVS